MHDEANGDEKLIGKKPVKNRHTALFVIDKVAAYRIAAE